MKPIQFLRRFFTSFNEMKNFLTKLAVIFFVFLIILPFLQFYADAQMFIKPLFILAMGACALLMVFKKTNYFGGLLASGLLILFGTFLLLMYCNRWGNGFPYVYLLGLFVLLLVLQDFKSDYFGVNNSILVVVYLVLITIEVLLFLLSTQFHFFRFIPNNSIFSILLAAQVLFVIPYIKYLYGHRNYYKVCAFIFIALCYCILFYTGGRSGILGFTAGLILLNYRFLRVKINVFIVATATLTLIVFLFNTKSGSSNGRLLIYKIVFEQVQPRDLIFGIGYGNFKVKYNQFQAQYFAKNLINNDEALLADDTIYLYNDPLQLVIEMGLLGLAVLIFGTIHFFRYLRRDYSLFDENSILCGAYLSVICIVVSSFFSFPFKVSGIVVHFTICIAIIVSFPQKHVAMHQFLSQDNLQNFFKIAMLIAATCLLFLGYQSFVYYQKVNDAVLLSKAGFRKESIKNYRELYHSFVKDGDVIYSFADELTKVNQLDSAIIVLNEAMKFRYDKKYVALLGNILFEKKQISAAEKQFIQAVFLDPKLFRPRQILFEFYCETKQWKKAMFWGNSILNLKVKIPSKSIKNIKKETNKRLFEIKRFL